MRITLSASVIALTALVATGSPAHAKQAEAPKAAASAASSSCSAYQQAPDGSWTPLPCKETGGDRGQTQHRPAEQGSEPEAR